MKYQVKTEDHRLVEVEINVTFNVLAQPYTKPPFLGRAVVVSINFEFKKYEGVAVCSPCDTFYFATGAKLAMERALANYQDSVEYQLLIFFLITGSSGFGTITAVWIASRRLFDERQRLRLDRLRTPRQNNH